MVGRTNTSGIKVTCPNPKCGYSWLYSGSANVTSCPRCGYRTRVSPANKISTPQGDDLTGSRDRGPLI